MRHRLYPVVNNLKQLTGAYVPELGIRKDPVIGRHKIGKNHKPLIIAEI